MNHPFFSGVKTLKQLVIDGCSSNRFAWLLYEGSQSTARTNGPYIITIQNIIYTYQEEKSYIIENITSMNGNQVGMTTHETCYK